MASQRASGATGYVCCHSRTSWTRSEPSFVLVLLPGSACYNSTSPSLSALSLQDEEQAKWEAEKSAQAAKLRRDKLTLEKQSRALLKLPTKKERSEVRETVIMAI